MMPPLPGHWGAMAGLVPLDPSVPSPRPFHCFCPFTVKVKLHYAYKVRNIGRVRPRLRFCVLC